MSIWSSWWAQLAVWGVAIAAAHGLDAWAFGTLTDPAVLAGLRGGKAYSQPVMVRDWYQMLRQCGSVLPWIALAGVLWLIETDRREPVSRRAPGVRPMMILSSVLIAGAVAEIVKPFVGRMRPEDTLGAYKFFSFTDAFGRWSDCGMPSSHAAVAFAGALAVSAFHKRAAWVLVPIAVGTAWSRVANANHFLSDVVAGAAIGAIGVLLCRRVFDVR